MQILQKKKIAMTVNIPNLKTRIMNKWSNMMHSCSLLVSLKAYICTSSWKDQPADDDSTSDC